jgi:thioredoxin 1
MYRQRHQYSTGSFRPGASRTRSKPGFQPVNISIRRIEPLSEKIVHTSDSGFEADVLQSDKPVLVDFWAEWCSPCKMIAPLLGDVVEDYEDRMKIIKLNIDENPNTPSKYGVRSIPTLMLFKGGAVDAQIVGAMSKKKLTEFLENNL